MKKNIKHDGPGRPAYKPKFPAKLKFTMTDFCVRNEVNPETGKGPNCSKLTLVKYLDAQLKNRRSGLICKVKDETAAPASESGLGRRSFLYYLRSRASEIVEKATAKSTKPARKSSGLKTAAKSPVSVPLTSTADYEAQKKALGIDSTPTVSVPMAPAPAPTPAPVAETAPVATAPEVVPATTPTEAAPVTA